MSRLSTSLASRKILHKYYINEYLLFSCGTGWLIYLSYEQKLKNMGTFLCADIFGHVHLFFPIFYHTQTL